MSIVGMRISSPDPRSSRLPAESDAPTSYSRLRDTRPASTSEAFAVVPPMSKAIAFSIPSPCASDSAATTPAAGPDSSANTGRPRGRVGGHHPARRLHDRERRLEAARVEAGANRVDVALHQRPHVGVHDRGGAALVLLLLAQDLARKRDRQAGQLLAQDLPHAPLVLRVAVRVQQADGDRLDAELAQPPRDRAHLRVVERAQHLARRAHALVQLQPQAALDERRRLRPEEVVEMRHAHATQLQHVAEALRRHERSARAAALEHRVRRHRRPVHDLLERAVRAARQQLGDAVDDGHVVRRWRREHLVVCDLAARKLQQHVRERASDVGRRAHVRRPSRVLARSARSR